MHESNTFARKRNMFLMRAAAMIIPLAVLLVFLSQTVFAQNTYVITDGGRVVIYTTSMTDPVQVLGEAGLELDTGDTYTAQTGIGVSEITVRRNQQITIDHCGELLEVDTYGETVSDLLSRLNITVDDDTYVSTDLSVETFDGMIISVSRTVRSEEIYTTVIPHAVEYVNDASMPVGTETVLTEGVDGQLLCTANVVYVNGQEQSRTVVQQTVATQPVTEVIAVGTGAPSTQAEWVSGEVYIGDGYIITETGEVLTYTGTKQLKATAYNHGDEGCDMITATMTRVRIGTVAIDPKVIPYGTRMFIVTNDNQYVYGIATAEDCGGGIKGDRIDLYFPTKRECFDFGVRQVTVYFLGEE